LFSPLIARVAAAVVLSAGFVTGAEADASRSMARHEQRPGQGDLNSLIGVATASGDPARKLNSGYNTIYITTLGCPYVSCTFVMKIMSQIGNASSTGQWAINVLVDRQSVDGGPLLGDMPAANKFQIHNWSGQYTVARGSHTIAFQLYVPTAAVAYQYCVQYFLTTP
jgi:hypothetical protein